MDRTVTAKLVGKTWTVDSFGQMTETETETSVIARVESVTRAEFNSAGALGYKPDYRIAVHRSEYNGQDEVEINDVRYSVYRTFDSKTASLTELYLERKAGV